jgi:hypothetical protein
MSFFNSAAPCSLKKSRFSIGDYVELSISSIGCFGATHHYECNHRHKHRHRHISMEISLRYLEPYMKALKIRSLHRKA